MFLTTRQLGIAYDKIRQSAAGTTCSVVICAAADPDSLCALRILASLLRDDFISYRIVPVSGYADLDSINEELKQQAESGEGGIRSVITINCGGSIDLGQYFTLPSNVIMYVVDSHRPFNLYNLYANDQVVVLDDGDIEEEMMDVRQAFERLETELTDNEEDEDDVDNDEDDDIDSDDDNDQIALDDDDDDYSDNDDNDTDNENEGEGENENEDDADEMSSGSGGSTKRRLNNQQDSNEQRRKRPSLEGGMAADGTDNDDNGDENNDSNSSKKKSKKNKKRNKKRHGKSREEKLLEREEARRHREIEKHQRIKERDSLKERIAQYYLQGSFHGQPSSVAMLMMAKRLGKPRNSDQLWMAITGLTYHYVYDHLDALAYEEQVTEFKNELEIMENSSNTSQLHQHHQLHQQLQQSNAQTAQSRNQVEFNGDIDRLVDEDQRQLRLQQLDNDQSQALNTALVESNERIRRTLDNRVPPEKIKFNTEYKFVLYRHWSLYESIYHSPHVASKLMVWTDKGRDTLDLNLTKIGFSHQEAKQPFVNVTPELRQMLSNKLTMKNHSLDLHPCFHSGLSYSSFVRGYGWTKGCSEMSASDMVYSTIALLNGAASNSNSVEWRNSDGSIGTVGGNDDGNAWLRGFYTAYDSLSDHGMLLSGVSFAIQLQSALIRSAKFLIDRKAVRTLSTFRLIVISDAQGLSSATAVTASQSSNRSLSQRPNGAHNGSSATTSIVGAMASLSSETDANMFRHHLTISLLLRFMSSFYQNHSSTTAATAAAATAGRSGRNQSVLPFVMAMLVDKDRDIYLVVGIDTYTPPPKKKKNAKPSKSSGAKSKANNSTDGNSDEEDEEEIPLPGSAYAGNRRNHFGTAFLNAAQKIDAQTRHNAFDMSVMEIRGAELQNFITALRKELTIAKNNSAAAAAAMSQSSQRS